MGETAGAATSPPAPGATCSSRTGRSRPPTQIAPASVKRLTPPSLGRRVGCPQCRLRPKVTVHPCFRSVTGSSEEWAPVSAPSAPANPVSSLHGYFHIHGNKSGQASGLGNHNCSAQIGRVNDHERTDETSFQGEFNGVPGPREQSKQCTRTFNRIQYSNRPDLQKKSQKMNNTVGIYR